MEQWTGKSDPNHIVVSKKLGFLPLAIKLAGALMQEGYSPQDWLKGFDRVSRIAIDTPLPSREESLDVSISLGVEAAFSSQEADRKQLYYVLGIFKEGTHTPQDVVIRLWKQMRPDLDEFTLSRTMDSLVRLALVERYEDKTVTMHALLHSYCAEYLGNKSPDYHKVLLEAFNPDNKPWHTLEYDEYLYEYLVYHLIFSQRDEAMLQLFRDEQWMGARYTQDGFTYVGYIADLILAWKHLATQVIEHDSVQTMADCIRLAMLRTSINTLSSNYIPEVVAQAVRLGIWTAEQGLQIASNIPDPIQRANLFTLLVKTGCLSQNDCHWAKQRALEAIPTINNSLYWAKRLSELAPLLDSGLIMKALEIAVNAEDDEYGNRNDAIEAIVGCLPSEGVSAGIKASLSVDVFYHQDLARAAILAQIAPKVSASTRQEYLDAIETLSNEGAKQYALDALNEETRAKQLEDRRAADEDHMFDFFNIKNQKHKKTIFDARTLNCGDSKNNAVLNEAIELALNEYYPQETPGILEHLAPVLDNQHVDYIFNTLISRDKGALEVYRHNAFVEIACLLNVEQVQRLLSQSLHMPPDRHFVELIVTLAKAQPSEKKMQLIAQALNLVEQLDQYERREPLEAIASIDGLSPLLQLRILGLALMMEGFGRASDDVIQAFAPNLDEGLVLPAWVVAELIDTEVCKARALLSLLPRIPNEDKEQKTLEVLDVVVQAGRFERVDLLVDLIPTLITVMPSEMVDLIEQIVEKEHSHFDKAILLIALAEQLDGNSKQQFVSFAFKNVREIGDEYYRAKAMSRIVPLVAESQISDVVEEIKRFEADSQKVPVVVALLAKTDNRVTRQLLDALLDAVLEFSDLDMLWAPFRGDVLLDLAPHLTRRQVRRAFESIMAIKEEVLRAVTLSKLAHEVRGFSKDILAALLSVSDPYGRARAFSHMIGLTDFDSDFILKQARIAIVAEIEARFEEDRSSLFYFVGNDEVFRPPIIPAEILEKIADEMMKVYTEWKWL